MVRDVGDSADGPIQRAADIAVLREQMRANTDRISRLEADMRDAIARLASTIDALGRQQTETVATILIKIEGNAELISDVRREIGGLNGGVKALMWIGGISIAVAGVVESIWQTAAGKH